MIKFTPDQIKQAVEDVKQHLKNTQHAADGSDETPRKTIGVVTVQMYDDGQYGYGFSGLLSKGLTIGAMSDATLSFRELITSYEHAEIMQGVFAASMLKPNDIN